MQISFSIRCAALVLALLITNQALAMNSDTTATKKVLSIGPGVLLGYIKIQVLEAIEKRTGRPTSELFDFIGGTSTGALIASLLTHGEHGKPTYTATQVREFYEDFAPEIFASKTKSLADVLSIEEIQDLKRHFLDSSYQIILRIFEQIGCAVEEAEQMALRV